MLRVAPSSAATFTPLLAVLAVDLMVIVVIGFLLLAVVSDSIVEVRKTLTGDCLLSAQVLLWLDLVSAERWFRVSRRAASRLMQGLFAVAVLCLREM
jgi:hypothetical protein